MAGRAKSTRSPGSPQEVYGNPEPPSDMPRQGARAEGLGFGVRVGVWVWRRPRFHTHSPHSRSTLTRVTVSSTTTTVIHSLAPRSPRLAPHRSRSPHAPVTAAPSHLPRGPDASPDSGWLASPDAAPGPEPALAMAMAMAMAMATGTGTGTQRQRHEGWGAGAGAGCGWRHRPRHRSRRRLRRRLRRRMCHRFRGSGRARSLPLPAACSGGSPQRPDRPPITLGGTRAQRNLRKPGLAGLGDNRRASSRHAPLVASAHPLGGRPPWRGPRLTFRGDRTSSRPRPRHVRGQGRRPGCPVHRPVRHRPATAPHDVRAGAPHGPQGRPRQSRSARRRPPGRPVSLRDRMPPLGPPPRPHLPGPALPPPTVPAHERRAPPAPGLPHPRTPSPTPYLQAPNTAPPVPHRGRPRFRHQPHHNRRNPRARSNSRLVPHPTHPPTPQGSPERNREDWEDRVGREARAGRANQEGREGREDRKEVTVS